MFELNKWRWRKLRSLLRNAESKYSQSMTLMLILY